jgi:hypothetical protein
VSGVIERMVARIHGPLSAVEPILPRRYAHFRDFGTEEAGSFDGWPGEEFTSAIVGPPAPPPTVATRRRPPELTAPEHPSELSLKAQRRLPMMRSRRPESAPDADRRTASEQTSEAVSILAVVRRANESAATEAPRTIDADRGADASSVAEQRHHARRAPERRPLGIVERTQAATPITDGTRTRRPSRKPPIEDDGPPVAADPMLTPRTVILSREETSILSREESSILSRAKTSPSVAIERPEPNATPASRPTLPLPSQPGGESKPPEAAAPSALGAAAHFARPRAPQSPQRREQRAAEQATPAPIDVTVSIDHIEVRAAPAPERRRKETFRPSVTLDDFLKRGSR